MRSGTVSGRRRAFTVRALATLLLAGVGQAGCAGASRPNVLLVTLDTTRADHASGYGYAHPTTPALDRLMAHGAHFVAAYTPMPTTGPSHASLFTSRYPFAHGMVKNGSVLADEVATLAEVLRDGGYQTAAVVSAFPLARRFGLDRGFEHYDDTFPAASASVVERRWEAFALAEAFDRRADATTDRALAWLASASGRRPFFLWVHYYDAHAPYEPPRGYRRRFRERGGGRPRLARQVAGYDGEMRFVDDQLGRLLEQVDRRGPADTVVVVAADHGEGLMQHGWMEHGINLHEELVRVVLVVSWTGHVAAGRVVDAPVSLLDVAPTVLDLVGLPALKLRPEGQTLAAVLTNGDAPPDRVLYFQRRLYTPPDRREWPAMGDMVAVRAGPWKYIEASEEGVAELYHVPRDPAERRNLRMQELPTATRLAALARGWLAEQRSRHGAVEPRIRDEDAARLRALGYMD